MLRKLLFVLMVFVLSFAAVSPAFAQSSSDAGAPGSVFVLTNNPANNQVVAYSRASDGSLAPAGQFSTGGKGSGVGLTVPPDPLGSQNSLILSPDGRWLFAVNAGSDQISSFRVLPDSSLRLADTASSGGSYPVSLAFNQGRLFVLNAGGDGSISGFKVSESGRLNPIENSTRSLNAATPAIGAQPNILEAPGQVAFSPDGKFLIVTDKGGVSGTGRLLVFSVSSKGTPSAGFEVTNTQLPVPFSLAFDPFGHLLVVDASKSAVTSYALGHDGDLTEIDSVVTGQPATCWIVVTSSGNIFTDNTGGNSISALSSSPSGHLEVLNAGGPAALTGAGTLPLDLAASQDGRFLYSLEVGAGQVAIHQVGKDGSLSSLGTVGGFTAGSGAQGIAAR